MSCKNIGITLNLPRGSKLAGTYPEIARLSGTTLGCKALSLLAGFTLIDGGKLRIEIDCQANVAWILTADEKAPDLRSILHVTVEGDLTEAEIKEVCDQFANATCAPGDTTIISPAGIVARVEEKSSGPGLEVVRLLVDKK